MSKISNIKYQISKTEGYTLVEMLAVIVVFSIIGGIISAIFASSLRGSNKANITNEVRQNGNYALSQMSKNITYARSFVGISEEEDGPFFPDCYSDPTTSTTIPPKYHYLQISDFNGGTITFSCDLANSKIASNDANLIDSNVVKVVDHCDFTCNQSSIAQSPTIGISFKLSQKSDTNFFEQKANISFETTIGMRNSVPE
jgi:prepilin-type N-terminal cleavage/methylation domain-containing protein